MNLKSAATFAIVCLSLNLILGFADNVLPTSIYSVLYSVSKALLVTYSILRMILYHVPLIVFFWILRSKYVV